MTLSKASLTANFETMPLHLIKLAVGCESVKELKELGRPAHASREAKRLAASSHTYHRMTPNAAKNCWRAIALLGHPGGNRGPRKKSSQSSRSATATGSEDAGW